MGWAAGEISGGHPIEASSQRLLQGLGTAHSLGLSDEPCRNSLDVNLFHFHRD